MMFYLLFYFLSLRFIEILNLLLDILTEFNSQILSLQILLLSLLIPVFFLSLFLHLPFSSFLLPPTPPPPLLLIYLCVSPCSTSYFNSIHICQWLHCMVYVLLIFLLCSQIFNIIFLCFKIILYWCNFQITNSLLCIVYSFTYYCCVFKNFYLNFFYTFHFLGETSVKFIIFYNILS